MSCLAGHTSVMNWWTPRASATRAPAGERGYRRDKAGQVITTRLMPEHLGDVARAEVALLTGEPRSATIVAACTDWSPIRAISRSAKRAVSSGSGCAAPAISSHSSPFMRSTWIASRGSAAR